MKTVFLSALMLVAMGLVGCTALPPKTVDEAYQKTTFQDDEYAKVRKVVGPKVTINIGIDGGGIMMMRKVGTTTPDIVFSTFAQFGWCFFNSAIDKNAGAMKLTKIRSYVQSGGVTNEDFYLTLTDAQVEIIKVHGFNARIYGTNRNVDVTLPPVYVQGFLKKSEELTKQ